MAGEGVEIGVPIEIPTGDADNYPGEEGDGVIADLANFHEDRGDETERQPVADSNEEVEVDKWNPFDEVCVDKAERIADDDGRKNRKERSVCAEFSGVMIRGVLVVVHISKCLVKYL